MATAEPKSTHSQQHQAAESASLMSEQDHAFFSAPQSASPFFNPGAPTAIQTKAAGKPAPFFQPANAPPPIQAKCNVCEGGNTPLDGPPNIQAMPAFESEDTGLQGKHIQRMPAFESEDTHVLQRQSLFQVESSPTPTLQPSVQPTLQPQRNTWTAQEKRQPEESQEGDVLSQELSALSGTDDNNDTAGSPIQFKLKIGQPGDIYEREADAMADRVINTNTSETKLQTKLEQSKIQIAPFKPTIQTKSTLPKVASDNTTCSDQIATQLDVSKGKGSPLDEATRSRMEPTFGADFSNVRIHTDRKATQLSQDLGAQAFTHGSDIYFNTDKYDPESRGGQHLLAHELTHTIQQGESKIRKQSLESEGKVSELENKYSNIAQSGEQESASKNIENSEDKNADSKRAEARQRNQTFLQGELGEAEAGGNVRAAVQPGTPTILKPTKSLDSQPSVQDLPDAEDLPGEAVPALDTERTDQTKGKDQADRKEEIFSLNEKASPKGTNSLSEQSTPPPSANNLRGFFPKAETLSSPQFIPSQSVGFQEFETWITDKKSVEENRQEEATLLANFQARLATEKGLIVTKTATQKASIQGEIQIRIDSVNTQTTNYTAQVSTEYAQKKVALTGYATQQKEFVTQQLSGQIAQIEQSTASHIEVMMQDLLTKKTEFDAYITAQKQELVSIAQAEADRADGELDSAANQAISDSRNVANRFSGSESPRSKQRRAASSVGSDSARDIREKKPSIRVELVTQARDFGQQYAEFQQQIHGQIQETEQSLTQGLQNSKGNTLDGLRQNHQAIIQRMSTRLQSDLQVLETSEQNFITNIRQQRDATIEQLNQLQTSTLLLLDETSQAIQTGLEQTAIEIEINLDLEQEPFMPGVRNLIIQAEDVLMVKKDMGMEQVQNLAAQTLETIGQVAESFQQLMNTILGNAHNTADNLFNNGKRSLDQSLQLFQEQAQNLQTELEVRQKSMLQEAMAQIDQGIEQAKVKVEELREEFRSSIKKAADESLVEAKKPLTDQVSNRAEEAAIRAGEPWWKGALRALGEILLVLVILVAVAALVVLIAGAFSVVLTLGQAMLIVGAVVLGVALIGAIIHRATQVSQGHSPWILLLAIPDAIGVTSIIEAFRGRELVTNTPLSEGEKWYRGITGIVQLIGTALIVLGGVRVIRAGGFETTRIPGGWEGVKEAFTQSIKDPLSEGLTGLREWFTRRESSSERGVDPSGVQRQTIRVRLAEYYRRLGEARRARSAEEGLRQVSEILDQVENDLSGIPKKNPPPPPKQSDGRMYPPLDDYVTRHPDGRITARTKGHNIELGRNGRITIRNRRTGNIEFKKPGFDEPSLQLVQPPRDRASEDGR